MQIKDLPASSTLAGTDMLAKDNSSGTTQKITGADMASQLKSLGGFLSAFQIPQSNFTWDSNNASFVSVVASQPSGMPARNRIKGLTVISTSGAAVMGGYIKSNGDIYVTGWIPIVGQAISSNYTFECYLLYV